MNTIEKYGYNIMSSYARQPVVLEGGRDGSATDENGKSYIDFGSGIGTNSLGFCNEKWVEAVCNQARMLQHTSNIYYTAVQADFAEKLCNLTGYSKLFLSNSGAEANECAIKLARKYSYDKYGKGRHNIITLVNSFHGRTLCTLSATGQDAFHNYFFPFPEGFIYTEANNIDALKSKLDGTVCAVMLEYLQGEGGVIPLEREFVEAVYEICAANDILVIADEIQTGIGRTGKLLAGEWYGKKADITTLAKGLAGGLPIGACLANEKCADVFTPGTHGSTFGGNPLSCAGGLVVLDTVASDGFLDAVTEKAAYFKEHLIKIGEVQEISGMGLMIGIALKTKKADDVVKAAIDNGLLLLTAKEKVRFLPPLTIEMSEIEAGMDIVKKILEV